MRRDLVESRRNAPETVVVSHTASHKFIVEPGVIELEVMNDVATGLKFRAEAVEMCRYTVKRLVRVSVDAWQVLVLQVLANEFFFLGRC
jgi:hypothetical protein